MTKFIQNLEEKTQSVLFEGLADDAAELIGVSKDVVADAVKGLSYANYLELGNAIDIDDAETVREILSIVADLTPGDDIDLEEDGALLRHYATKYPGPYDDELDIDTTGLEWDDEFGYNLQDHPDYDNARLRYFQKKYPAPYTDELEEDRYDDETQECFSCYGRGIEYDETCLNCGGKGRTMKDNSYIDDEWEEEMYALDQADLGESWPKPRDPYASDRQRNAWPGDTVEYKDAEGPDVVGSGPTRLNGKRGVVLVTPLHKTKAGLVRVRFDGRQKASLVRDEQLTVIMPANKDFNPSMLEADNPSAPAKATPTQPAVTPPSAGSSINALAEPAETAVDKDNNEMQQGRKEVDDLDIGDEIEVADIDGEPAAGRVRNPNGPGDTLVITGKGNEEHMIRKDSILSTPFINIPESLDNLKEQYEAALAEKGRWTRIKNKDGKLGQKMKRAERFEKKRKDKDSVDEAWPQEETYDEMVEYWKQSLSSSIVRKGVFRQMYDAAGQDIEVLNDAIADQAESIADSYHGSGEGIGSSDQNHFIYNIAQSLGIKDVFGWRDPNRQRSQLKSPEEMERDKVNRYAEYNKVIRGRDGLGEAEGFHFFVDPQGEGANVMNSNGEVHDYYEDPEVARKEAEKLNAQYGEVEEARNARNTEHSGAKKGKGGYYGRKKDAKSDSNKKRRENDKSAIANEELNRIRKLAGLEETASGGATGAGAIASAPAAMNGMQSRNPSIYGQTKLRTKPAPKKRKTTEDSGEGVGRSKKK